MVIVDTDIFQSAVRIRHGMDDIGGVDPQTVNKIVIERKKSEEGVWLKIREVNIITSDDIVFTLHDYTALSRQSYDYRSVCISEAGETQGVVVSITPITQGIVIADRLKGICFFIQLQVYTSKGFFLCSDNTLLQQISAHSSKRRDEL